jgi:hypothetical protein
MEALKHNLATARVDERRERRETGITARQQRKRLHLMFNRDRIDERRYERLWMRRFRNGPGCQVRERRCAALLTRADRRFLLFYPVGITPTQAAK